MLTLKLYFQNQKNKIKEVKNLKPHHIAWIIGSLLAGWILLQASFSFQDRFSAAAFICAMTAIIMVLRYIFNKINLPNKAITFLIICLAISAYGTQVHGRLVKFVEQKRPSSFHYFLGSKYFNELGYYGLYRYSVLADSELNTPTIKDVSHIRHLEDLSTMPIEDAKALAAKEINEYFPSKSRWKEYKRDWELIGKNSSSWNRKLNDHGFNPPPFWNLIPGTIAQYVQVKDKKTFLIVRLADLAIFLVIVGLVIYYIGLDIGLIIFIFISTAVCWYYPHFFIDTYFQFQWLAALMLMMLFYRLGKNRASAISMAYSAAVSVFPLVFISGIGIKWLKRLVQNRKLPKIETSYVVVFFVFIAFTVPLGFTQAKGIASTQQFFDDITQHAHEITFHGNKYGLKRTLSNDFTNIDKHNSEESFVSHKEYYYLFFGLIALLNIFAIYINIDKNDWIIPLTSSFIFLLTTASRYYYLFLIVYFIPHSDRKYTLFYTVALVYIFLMHLPLMFYPEKNIGGFNIFNFELLGFFLLMPTLLIVKKVYEIKKEKQMFKLKLFLA